MHQAKPFSESLFWLCSPALCIDIIVRQALSMKLRKKWSLKTRFIYFFFTAFDPQRRRSFSLPVSVYQFSGNFYCTNHSQAIGIGDSDWPGFSYIPTPAGRRAHILRYQKLGKDSPREL